jgi:ubiquinone/menaquinone biosynthesis C-methylase UbiE
MAGNLHEIFGRIRRSVRRRRYKVIAEAAGIETLDGFILDLGGGPASFFAAMFPDPSRVILVDIDYRKAVLARKNQPQIVVVVGDAECLPFADSVVRFTVSNSVIEHVNNPDAMAFEVRRVSRGYFLQTPNGAFPVETHSFIPIPFYNLIPIQWIKKLLCALFRANFDYISTVRYLSEHRLVSLFPDAMVLYEKALGLKKSFYVYLADKKG